MVVIRGKDTYGSFTITGGRQKGKKPENCCYCGKPGLLVKYIKNTFNLNGIDVERTILKDVDNRIGLLCGCYGKFHRQVAHIRDNMARRAHSEERGGQRLDHYDG